MGNCIKLLSLHKHNSNLILISLRIYSISSIQEPIVLHRKTLTKHRVTQCLGIQVLTTERWLSFRQLRRALEVSRNNQTLRDLIHDLVYDGYLKTWHTGMQGPEQRYQMRQMLLPLL